MFIVVIVCVRSHSASNSLHPSPAMNGLTATDKQKVLAMVLQNQCEKFDLAMKKDQYAVEWLQCFCNCKRLAKRGTSTTYKDQWNFYYNMPCVESATQFKAQEFVRGNAATAARLMGLCKMHKIDQIKDIRIGLPLSGLKDFRILTPSMTNEFYRCHLRNRDAVEEWKENSHDAIQHILLGGM